MMNETSNGIFSPEMLTGCDTDEQRLLRGGGERRGSGRRKRGALQFDAACRRGCKNPQFMLSWCLRPSLPVLIPLIMAV